MLKRNLIGIAILSLALVFSANAFGQNNKLKAKPKSKPVAADAFNGYGSRRKPTNKIVRNSPKKFLVGSNLMKGHEGMQERKAAPGNATGRKGSQKVRNFSSTTQPFADGLRKKGSPNK